MLKILVVDDSLERVKILQERIEECSFYHLLEVSYVDTADKARTHLLSSYDLLILDVLIPKKLKTTAQAVNSFNLLSDISNPKKKYIRPNLIVGFTADTKELGSYRDFFYENASVVLDGSLTNLDWLEKIMRQITTAFHSKQKTQQLTQDNILITVHGIRTYGQWQNSLSKEVKKFTRSFEFIEIKYGFFDLISFTIPFLRKRKINEIAKRLKLKISENSSKNTTIIAHSFGTLIVSKAMEMLPSSVHVTNVILCGSPLSNKHDIEHITSRSKLTINECGIQDYILLLAKCFILGLGDAGRSGLLTDNSKVFLNRYFKGGHDLYFKGNAEGDSFFNEYWLPVIVSQASPVSNDSRSNYFGQDAVDIFVKIAFRIKWLFYILPMIALIHYFL